MNMLARSVFFFLLCSTAVATTVDEPFGPRWFIQPAENLGSVINGPGYDSSPTISSDGLTLIFASERPGGQNGSRDLWQSTRPSLDAPWTEPTNLGLNVNGSLRESGPDLSSDGLTLFYYRQDLIIGHASQDLYQSTRSTLTSPWGPAIPVPGVNSSAADNNPMISADGLTLMFCSYRPGSLNNGGDLWQVTRPSVDAAWGPAFRLNEPINTTNWDGSPSLSEDGLILAFSSSRGGKTRVWFSSRVTESSPWGTPTTLEAIESPDSSSDSSPEFSEAARSILFGSTRTGGYGGQDIWSITANRATAYTRFTEPPVGTGNFVATGDELGFTTTILGNTGGANPLAGVAGESEHRFRMRSTHARTVFETVDLTNYLDTEFSTDVLVSETSWESDDFVSVSLSNGLTTIPVVGFDTPIGLDGVEGVWHNYRVSIPDDWTQATLTITSRTNSSNAHEYLDFDNVAFFGTPIPEPSAPIFLAFGAFALALIGRPSLPSSRVHSGRQPDSCR